MKLSKHAPLSLSVLLLASTAALGAVNPEAVLKKKFPKLTVDGISPSPVRGLSEVISGGNVFYYDPATGNLIFGEIWSDAGKKLTAEARQKIQAAKYRFYKEHLADAVKIGSGKHEVIEITDPDCPYCRSMHAYWKARHDVTRYVFFNPLPQLHPEAVGHTRHILSAPDPEKALEEIATGKYDASPAAQQLKPNEKRIKSHADLAARSGISGTPAYYVNGTFISGANRAAIENLIGKGAK